MPRESTRRRQGRRLRRLLPCLGKDFVMIPVSFMDPIPSEWPGGKNFCDAVLAAGAVEVIHGRVPVSNLNAALDAEIRMGHLPEDARKLARHVEEISVFCYLCGEDIRRVVKTIEAEKILDLGYLQVENIFIGYKNFKKDILFLGTLDLKCISPRHSRPSAVSVQDQGYRLTDASIKYHPDLWEALDDVIASYYKRDHVLTELFDITYQELSCTVYRLFVNKQFFLEQSASVNDSEGILGVCRMADSSGHSVLIAILLKMLGILKARLQLHFAQPSGMLEKVVTCSNFCKEQMEVILMSIKDMDVDGSFYKFVSELGLEWADIFQLIILSSPDLKHELQETILGLIERVRGSLQIDENLLRDAIEVLQGCSLVEDIVEMPYLRSVSRRYSCLSSRLIQTLGVGEYLQKIENCVDEEVQFAVNFMGSKIGNEITIRVVKEMVGDHMARLVDRIDSHLCHLISAGSYNDIRRMFKLVRKLPEGYASLSTALTNYIRRSLTGLVADKEKQPIEYIEQILQERDKYERIIRSSLGRDMQLISKACFILREISRENFQLSEYLSLYIDHVLMQDQADCEAGDAALDRAVTVVGDFDDKSAFEIYYQRHLADRLLSGRYSEEREMKMLLKLRGYCCQLYMHKLKIMIFDIKTSQEVMGGFYESNLTQNASRICAHILTSNIWPRQPFIVCNLPSELVESWMLFRAYYLSLHCGRKLDWYPNLGSAVITAKFGMCDREYELIVPMHHMSVLMLFNSADRLSFLDIQERTGIPGAHLVKCLYSMTCDEGKNVLCKDSKGQITRKDHFSVNEQFSSQSDKLKFDRVVTLKNAEVILDEERSSVIDCFIVKMLKERPATGLLFNSIVKGLVGLLKKKFPKFRVTPRAVQKRINSLIEWNVVKKEKRDERTNFKYNP